MPDFDRLIASARSAQQSGDWDEAKRLASHAADELVYDTEATGKDKRTLQALIRAIIKQSTEPLPFRNLSDQPIVVSALPDAEVELAEGAMPSGKTGEPQLPNQPKPAVDPDQKAPNFVPGAGGGNNSPLV